MGMESTYSRRVDAMLIEWARWRLYHSGEVRGYPSQTPFRRLLGGGVATAMLTDTDAEAVDSAVSRLSQRCPTQGRILTSYYLDGATLSMIARDMSLSATTARDELRAARGAVEWILECGGKLSPT